MGYDEPTLTPEEDDVPVDASEASEAEGVEQIEMPSPPLGPDEAATLDGRTLEGLGEEDRADLGVSAAAAAGGPVALSANFSLSEFHCCNGHCAAAFVPASAVPALRRLVTQVLQPMRDRFGRCTVNSGFRTKLHNDHVHGETNSHHRYDQRPDSPAADVTFQRGTVNEWAAEARRLMGNSIGGVGRYPSQRFVHVDLGPARKWDG